MKKYPDKDIYELIDNDIDNKFEKYKPILTHYKPEERIKNFEELKFKKNTV
jgi:hypothetical protein